ncbi:MAG: hypothetical protein AAF791_03715 [Bacteroidota bacterium]
MMNARLFVLLWSVVLWIGIGCSDPGEFPEETTVRLPSSVTGTPSSPDAFGAATVPHPTIEPEAGWDTLWTVLGSTPLGPDEMVRVGPFPPEVVALNDTEVEITGYMMPLDASTAPTRFLLVGVPLADCAFCIPRGPAGAIEVLASEGIPGTYEPITIQGRFHVLDDDPMGLLFRLTDAALQ